MPPIFHAKHLKRFFDYVIFKKTRGHLLPTDTLCRNPTPKGGASQWVYMSLRTSPTLVRTEQAFLFSLISLIEKGKQCNKQNSKGNQQANYPKENHNDFIICHMHHLPSYVFRKAGCIGSGGYHPCRGFHEMNFIIAQLDFQLYSVVFHVPKSGTFIPKEE